MTIIIHNLNKEDLEIKLVILINMLTMQRLISQLLKAAILFQKMIDLIGILLELKKE